MERFTRLRGIAAPLLEPNVETGALAPAKWALDHPNNLGQGLFQAWRFDPAGRENPDFVLNRPKFRAASILIAGINFGCGSSRETAVWALLHYGIRCVIAPSFGDIFRDNCYQNGLLPVTLAEDAVNGLATLMEALVEPVLTVDLERRRIERPDGFSIGFEITEDRQASLLDGLDETLLIRRFEPDIAAFRAHDRTSRPWIYLPPR